MHARIYAAVSTTKAVVATARDTEITLLAAAVAYYAFASLLPALLFAHRGENGRRREHNPVYGVGGIGGTLLS